MATHWPPPKHIQPLSTEPLAILDLLDQTTVLSLALVVLLLSSAYAISQKALPSTTKTSYKVLFIWHFFDFLIHTVFEGSFLWNCFFSSGAFDEGVHSGGLVNGFLEAPDRLYGAAYADNWASKLWLVYAQADARWAGADLTVVSLEMLTVFVAGPMALWICWGIVKGEWSKVAFWMIVLATGEIYGGFMTFAPEWLTGSPNLDTSNFMYTWVYLFFFNMLWIVFPLYALYIAFREIGAAFATAAEVQGRRKGE